MVFEEGFLRFEFGERWQVLKLDEHPAYRSGIAILNGTKAVDFIGILDSQTLYLIEVKDFRGYRIENKNRLLGGELLTELGQKARDSLACILGVYRVSDGDEPWKSFIDCASSLSCNIRVVLWLE